MSHKKRFSIVIPSYQSKMQLGNTLRALDKQNGISKDSYEVIVVDDGSSDGTGEYIGKIPKGYEFKYRYLERGPESSRGRTRNTGIGLADGEIIVFLDSDILVREDYLVKMDEYFKFDEDILVIGYRFMMNEDVTEEDMNSVNLFENKKFALDDFGKLELRHGLFLSLSCSSKCNKYPWIHVFSCNMAVSRKNLDRAGYFDEGFKGWGMEDVEIGYRLYKIGVKIITGMKVDVFHQKHSPSNVITDPEERIRQVDENTEFFIKKHPKAMREKPEQIMKFFRGEAVIELDAVKGFKRNVSVCFKDKSELNEIKEKIRKLCRRFYNRVHVFDYVEDTDLDVWMQVQEGFKTMPRYYPMIIGKKLGDVARGHVADIPEDYDDF